MPVPGARPHTSTRPSAMAAAARDVRLAFRALARAPGFALLAIVTIALGIGANAAIFSVVNALLLRPLPYREPERLVRIYESLRDRPGWRGSASVPNVTDWTAQAKSFDAVVAYVTAARILAGEGDPERARTTEMSASAFTALGTPFLIGRGFTADEESPGSNRVVVLAEGFWRRRFGSDRSIVGRTISLDGVAHTVIGVSAGHADFPPGGFATELYLPFLPSEANRNSRNNHFLSVVGRLAPGATLESASREMREIAARLERDFPDAQGNRTVELVPLQEAVVGRVKPALLVLMGAVVLLLLIACANVANLQLARATVRERDLAVRLALGATRGELVRHVLAESLTIAFGGALLGAAIAWGGLRLLAPLLERALPSRDPVTVDATAFAFLLLVSLASGLAFGLAPAMRMTGRRLRDGVIGASGRTTAGGGQQRFRGALVVAQVAFSLMLLVGAGLLVRAFAAVRGVPSGIVTENVLTARLRPPERAFEEGNVVDRTYQPVLDRIRVIPGVRDAGMINVLPIQNWGWNGGYWIDGRPRPERGKEPSVERRAISPGYFRALSIPLVEGRDFEEQDGAAGEAPIVVNLAFARLNFPGASALGARVRTGDGEKDVATIVGVVGDVRQAGLDREVLPELYLPYRAYHGGTLGMTLVVRGALDPASLTNAMRDVVRREAPTATLADMRTMDEVIELSLASRRLSVALIGTFAALALVLATSGLYGVIAYLVAQRTREIGIRVALGSDRRRVMRLVVGHGGRLAAIGIVLGVAGGLSMSGVLRSMLYGVSARDPLTFIAVATLLAVVAVAASLVPAWRAAKTDPMQVLRS